MDIKQLEMNVKNAQAKLNSAKAQLNAGAGNRQALQSTVNTAQTSYDNAVKALNEAKSKLDSNRDGVVQDRETQSAAGSQKPLTTVAAENKKNNDWTNMDSKTYWQSGPSASNYVSWAKGQKWPVDKAIQRMYEFGTLNQTNGKVSKGLSQNALKALKSVYGADFDKAWYMSPYNPEAKERIAEQKKQEAQKKAENKKVVTTKPKATTEFETVMDPTLKGIVNNDKLTEEEKKEKISGVIDSKKPEYEKIKAEKVAEKKAAKEAKEKEAKQDEAYNLMVSNWPYKSDNKISLDGTEAAMLEHVVLDDDLKETLTNWASGDPNDPNDFGYYNLDLISRNLTDGKNPELKGFVDSLLYGEKGNKYTEPGAKEARNEGKNESLQLAEDDMNTKVNANEYRAESGREGGGAGSAEHTVDSESAIVETLAREAAEVPEVAETEEFKQEWEAVEDQIIDDLGEEKGQKLIDEAKEKGEQKANKEWTPIEEDEPKPLGEAPKEQATGGNFSYPSNAELLSMYYRGHMPNFKNKEEQDRFFENLRKRWEKDQSKPSEKTEKTRETPNSESNSYSNSKAPTSKSNSLKSDNPLLNLTHNTYHIIDPETGKDVGPSAAEIAKAAREAGWTRRQTEDYFRTLYNKDENMDAAYQALDDEYKLHEQIQERKSLRAKKERGEYLTRSEKERLAELDEEIQSSRNGIDLMNLDYDDVMELADKSSKVEENLPKFFEGGILHNRRKALDENDRQVEAINRSVKGLKNKIAKAKKAGEDTSGLEADLAGAEQDLAEAKSREKDIKSHYGTYIWDAIATGLGNLETWGTRGKKASGKESEWSKYWKTNVAAEQNRHNKAKDETTQLAINALNNSADIEVDNVKALNAIATNDLARDKARQAGAFDSWESFNTWIGQLDQLLHNDKMKKTEKEIALMGLFGLDVAQATAAQIGEGIEDSINKNK